ncbi:PREDICTED: uncharacterized protein K02A2.6-like [Priapulus caudatus]|uniref:RNA-directed DNA polymerase n=1 Tax=Priapulus caudatus TaxID=37621 RepID=A0ABM1E121_PRICU|nr:PREDICTED: uncharacterized protein K02A2.6-like [Priapulus caudatus]
MCRSSNRGHHAKPKYTTRVHTLTEAETATSRVDDEEELYFHTLKKQAAEKRETVTPSNSDDTQAFITLSTESDHAQRDISYKIDTGSEGNVISAAVYRSLLTGNTATDGVPPGLRPTQTKLIAFGGHTVEHYGTCSLTLTHREQSECCTFHVSKDDCPAIVGLPACRALKLVTLHYNINIADATSTPADDVHTNTVTSSEATKPRGDPVARENTLIQYSDCFEGTGCFTQPHHITLDPSVQPVVHSPRRVPVSLRAQLKAELDSLVEQDIIAKVERPTVWVNSIVGVTKPDGTLRICLDPKDLNEAIKRPHHYTPTLEEILPKLAGARWFFILDATKAYHSVSLDDESSYLTTFNTVYGRYRYRRCFGLKDAQDVFQPQIDATFGDIKGITGIADDLIVYGFDESGKEHDDALHAALQRTRESGVKFNKKKIVIRARRIPFFGHILGADGLQPDLAKVAAISAMTSPTDVKQMQRFLGMAIRHVIIHTDHKPLVSITKKSMVNIPPRLARMMLRVKAYDVDITYKPGRDIPLADALSRVNPCRGDAIRGMDITVHELHSQLSASPQCLQDIKRETLLDPELSQLCDLIVCGWPDKRAAFPPRLHGYWNYRDELSVHDGIIMKGLRILIPQSLRPALLEQIHYAHSGREKCKLRARNAVFWHGINRDIGGLVASCSTCQAHQPANKAESLYPHDVPPYAWHTLASDMFHWEQKDYLLVADMFSKFPVVRCLHSTTSRSVNNHLKAIFDEHGVPEEMLTDNGPQYTAAEFTTFAKQYGFIHKTNSPQFPSSNGFIERTVQTVKNVFTKARESGNDPHLAMLCLRTTPVDHNTPSPSELLNNRRYRANLSTIPVHTDGRINETLHLCQDVQKRFHDRRYPHTLPELRTEEIVRVTPSPSAGNQP